MHTCGHRVASCIPCVFRVCACQVTNPLVGSSLADRLTHCLDDCVADRLADCLTGCRWQLDLGSPAGGGMGYLNGVLYIVGDVGIRWVWCECSLILWSARTCCGHRVPRPTLPHLCFSSRAQPLKSLLTATCRCCHCCVHTLCHMSLLCVQGCQHANWGTGVGQHQRDLLLARQPSAGHHTGRRCVRRPLRCYCVILIIRFIALSMSRCSP